MINQTLNKRYKVTARLGKGAMGTVYLATDSQNGKEVALKIIASDLAIEPDMLERFKREAETLSKLKHPNIVEFLDAFEYEENYVIVMEYISGGSLHDLIKTGALPIERASRIALELCDALIRSHHLNIIHRDLKPENILLTKDGTPKLADFGVARLNEGTRMTRSGTQVGTPYYMAPEAWEGKTLDTQADIWSLGVVIFEMLTGKVPFGGDTGAAVMNKVLTSTPPNIKSLRNEIPAGMVKIVSRMLTRDKKRRYQIMRQVGVDLHHSQQAATAIPASHKSSYLWLMSFGIIIVLVAGVFLANHFFKISERTASEQTTLSSLTTLQVSKTTVVTTIATTTAPITSIGDVLLDQSHQGLTIDMEVAATSIPDNPEFLFIGQFYNGISKNYNVKIQNTSIEKNTLSNFKVLILTSADGLYFANEVKDILDFVSNGGGLLILQVGGGGTLDEILTPLGVRFLGRPLASPEHLSWGPWGFTVPVNSKNPILVDINEVTVNAGSAIEVDDPGNVLLWTSSSIWIDSNENQEQDAFELAKEYPVVVGLTYGQGKVVIFPAVEVWGGFYYDNERLFNQALAWLMLDE